MLFLFERSGDTYINSPEIQNFEPHALNYLTIYHSDTQLPARFVFCDESQPLKCKLVPLWVRECEECLASPELITRDNGFQGRKGKEATIQNEKKYFKGRRRE